MYQNTIKCLHSDHAASLQLGETVLNSEGFSYGVELAKKDLEHIITFCYRNASRLSRCNLPTVNAIRFLFSKLHSALFFYCLFASVCTPVHI